MASSAYIPDVKGDDEDAAVHSAVVRITHWINMISFCGLLVSGIAILRVHPRLYWGETGSVETGSLIDLPLPFVLKGQNGWGRSLHFLSAWFSVVNGLVYVASGLVTRHFGRNLLPARADLTWSSVTAFVSELRTRREAKDALAYNVHQRLAYAGVIFVLFPVLIWSGFAMSPALTSVFPVLVNLPGGQQSARTIHFFVASALVLFLVGHVGMVWLTGFTKQLRAMITGRGMRGRERG